MILPVEPFKILSLLKSNQVKIVIVGQDPYPGFSIENNKVIYHADGIAFSSMYTRKTPNSLMVLQKCFKSLGNYTWFPNDLSYLVEQGVFLMNAYWTVEEERPLSHASEKWYNFSIGVVNKIIRNSGQVPVITLGNHAKNMISNTNARLVFKESHPSSVRYSKESNWGINTFKEAIYYLKDEIKWGL